MTQIVIAAYRPKPGQDAALRDVLRDHMPVLRGEGLITERPALLLRADDGTILEIFEWRSAEAVAAAHENPAVQALWRRFEAVCEYVPPAEVPECRGLFPDFSPIAP